MAFCVALYVIMQFRLDFNMGGVYCMECSGLPEIMGISDYGNIIS